MPKHVWQSCVIAAGVCAVAVLIFRLAGSSSATATPPAADPAELTETVRGTAPTEEKRAALSRLGTYQESPAAPEQTRQVASTLRQTLQSSAEPPEVRAAAADSLGKLRAADAMPDLLRGMEDPDPWVRGRCGVAVQKIMGADYFFRATDPPADRKVAIQNIKHDWEYLKRNPEWLEYGRTKGNSK